MPDYAEMYKVLFRAQTRAIELLQQAQQAAEEIYIASQEPDIRSFPTFSAFRHSGQDSE